MQKEVKRDLREYKMTLRKKYKDIRRAMLPETKAERDARIFEKVISSKAYRECSLLMTYVSTSIEVDTHRLIRYSLEHSKRVAVPKCINGTREMKFYLITSMDDLEVATFSVLEPKVHLCEELKKHQDSKAVCIVPGLSFDMDGYRLGYGKGYYDRFLFRSKPLVKIGLCYCTRTAERLLRGKYDVPVDMLITEKYSKIMNHT